MSIKYYILYLLNSILRTIVSEYRYLLHLIVGNGHQSTKYIGSRFSIQPNHRDNTCDDVMYSLLPKITNHIMTKKKTIYYGFLRITFIILLHCPLPAPIIPRFINIAQFVIFNYILIQN